MRTGLLAKFISTAILSITSVALAAWALRIRERDLERRRQSTPSGTNPPKPRRSRLRRIAKWTGVAICVLLLATAIVSSRLQIVWRSGHPERHSGYANGPGGSVRVGVGQGMIRIVRTPPTAPWVLQSESHMRLIVQGLSKLPDYAKPGWTVIRHTDPFRWWPRRFGLHRSTPTTSTRTVNGTKTTHKVFAVELTLPIWMPFALAGALTAWLFWRDRRLRFPPGHCPCGYNLTGNVSGTCPECGNEAKP